MIAAVSASPGDRKEGREGVMGDREEEDLVPSRTDVALELGALLAGAAGWLGGPISTVLSGISVGRKIERVRDTLIQLGTELDTFRAEASEQYVRTDEFQELLEHTLRRVADERNTEKRRLYGTFLVNAIKLPGEPYDEQMRFLRTLDALQQDHVRVLRALLQAPARDAGMMGAPIQTLERRLPGMGREHISDLITQLNYARVTNLQSLQTTMTGHGAEELRSTVTQFGMRFVSFLREGGS